MAGRFKAFSAVFSLIMRPHEGKTQIPLHRRQNTSYMDGMWDTAASGHVDEGETANAASKPYRIVAAIILLWLYIATSSAQQRCAELVLPAPKQNLSPLWMR